MQPANLYDFVLAIKIIGIIAFCLAFWSYNGKDKNGVK